MRGYYYSQRAVSNRLGFSIPQREKAGFITAFYIVIVPVLGIFSHKKNQMEGMAGSVTGTCRIVLFVYYRVFFYWKGRYSGIFCVHLFFLCIFW